MFISFHFEAKRKDRKRNEAKRKMFGSEIKRKYALLISLWSEAQNLKRKIKFGFSRERAKRISFRFEAKNFFWRNRRTLIQTS